MTQTSKFTITGSIDIPESAISIYSSSGEIVGYKLKDGRIAKPIFALEIESQDGNSFEYVTSESAIANLGFTCLDYENTTFEPSNEHQSAIDSQDDEEMQLALQMVKGHQGAASTTFLRRDQCSFGNTENDEQEGKSKALYNELLVEIHKIGDILMTKPRGTYADNNGVIMWVSPLRNTVGADLFVYEPGGYLPQLNGSGTVPMAYYDELGCGPDVVQTIASLRNWLNNQVFGQIEPDYYLDLVAYSSDCCRYEEFANFVLPAYSSDSPSYKEWLSVIGKTA
jgi:hypothetical protein